MTARVSVPGGRLADDGGGDVVKIECPRAVPPCAYSFEQPTRYEALMELAEHLHDVHDIWPTEAMSLALTAPVEP